MLYLMSRMTILFCNIFFFVCVWFNRRLALSYLLLRYSVCIEVRIKTLIQIRGWKRKYFNSLLKRKVTLLWYITKAQEYSSEWLAHLEILDHINDLLYSTKLKFTWSTVHFKYSVIHVRFCNFPPGILWAILVHWVMTTFQWLVAFKKSHKKGSHDKYWWSFLFNNRSTLVFKKMSSKFTDLKTHSVLIGLFFYKVKMSQFYVTLSS